MIFNATAKYETSASSTLLYENLGNLLISMLNSLCCIKEQDSCLLKQTATLLIHIIGRFKKKAQLRRG